MFFIIYSRYKSLIRYIFENIFSHSVGCLFTFLVFLEQEFLDLLKCNLFIYFSFVAYAFGVISKNS